MSEFLNVTSLEIIMPTTCFLLGASSCEQNVQQTLWICGSAAQLHVANRDCFYMDVHCCGCGGGGGKRGRGGGLCSVSTNVGEIVRR